MDDIDDVVLSVGLELQDSRRETEPNYSFLRSEIFPRLKWLYHYEEDPFSESDSTPWLSHSLSRDEEDDLVNWVASNKTETLLVIGGRYPYNGLPQVTSFMVEMSKIFGAGLSTASHGDTAVVTHSFGDNTEAVDWRRENVVIQNLLVQLVDAHQHESSDPEICRRNCLTKRNLCAMADDPLALWDMFKLCVHHTGIHSLMVMLDRVDLVYLNPEKPDDTAFLTKLISKLRTGLGSDGHGISVKVMLTMGAAESAQLFDDDNAKTIVLKESPRQGPRRYEDY